MGTAVSLVDAENSKGDLGSPLSRALNLISYNDSRPVKRVAIKPNLCYYWDAYTGYTTDPRIVSGIIDILRDRHGSDVEIQVVESDATAMRTRHAFKMLGYGKLAKEKAVELFNLSEDNVQEITVNVKGQELSYRVPCLLQKVDLFVNVPKLKTMRETQITCAMKNIFGCIASPRKIIYHRLLNEAIVGINKILRPHITVVDGLTALGSLPARVGLIMASTDPFSVDWVASQIMGYDPSSIRFLAIAAQEKLGTADGISTCGENIAMFKERFPRSNAFFGKWSWKAQLGLLKLYHKITGDIVPPALEGM